MAFIFFLYPARKTSPRQRPTVCDGIWMLAIAAPTTYYIWNYESLLLSAGLMTDLQIALGACISLAALEACRRVLGWGLPIVALTVSAYAVWGVHFPPPLTHAGIPWERLLVTFYSGEGIYGIVARTYAVYVVLFMLLGAFLQRSGAGQAFVDLALAVIGRRGNPVQAAVLGSGLAGSILGAGAANVMVTGTFTIPLMKRSGVRGTVACAFETVASIGGHLLPPVMGAAAFLMASLTGTPYIEIIGLALIPGLLLYFSLFMSATFFVRREKKRGRIQPVNTPPLGRTLKRQGVFLLPVGVLIWALLAGFTPFRAAVLTIAATVVLGIPIRAVTKRQGLSPSDLWLALGEGAINTLVVGATAGVMGMVLAALVLPGAALSFSSWITALAGGSLVAGMLLTILASYVLGMGMTVTAAYVLIATIAAPALTDLGMPLLVAHLAIIWFSQDSSFTPPFALGSYIAAGIGKEPPMRVAWRSVLLGKPIYIIPFLMVYTPLLGGPGISFTQRAVAVVAAALGLFALSALMEQYCFTSLRVWDSAVLAVAIPLLFWPGYATTLLGVVVLTAFMIIQASRWHTQRGAMAAAGGT